MIASHELGASFSEGHEFLELEWDGDELRVRSKKTSAKAKPS